jgi:hypothetical protein
MEGPTIAGDSLSQQRLGLIAIFTKVVATAVKGPITRLPYL